MASVIVDVIGELIVVAPLTRVSGGIRVGKTVESRRAGF